MKSVCHTLSSFPVFVAAAVLLFGELRADAIIDATLQMQLGNPSGATADTNDHNHYLVQRTVEAIDYSDNLGEPNWASWDLTAADIGDATRSTTYFTDNTLPSNFYHVTDSDYNGVGGINFNRGHLCPSEDRTDTDADNDLVFYMSNIMPQAADNNQGVWASFESYCRGLANSGNELLILCGPSGFSGIRIPSGKAAIANYTWKIAVVVPPGGGTALSRITVATRVISLKIPNSNGISTVWQDFVTSANEIQVDTGLAFFTALPPDIASALRNKVDGETNPPPVITSFSPTNGQVNDAIIITGTNFGSALSVAFNGLSAPFTVNSLVQITATVPTNATSGPISVTTSSGTAISSNSFTVTGPLFADLAIAKTHTGNFAQRDIGDSYTIVVTNIGNGPSVGTVTVTDALPGSMVATAIGGPGWSADLNTLTCTRSDALAVGGSYPPITVTVTVASNAPVIVTNTAGVSGGGEMNSGNNTAIDPTIINPSGDGNTNAVLLAGWNVSGLPGGLNNFGPSPFASTTNAPNLIVGGLTRGSGVGTSGTGAARAWGGNTFTSSTAAAAVAANQFATFTVAPSNGYTVSFSSVSKFDYRHSATGPVNGLLQFKIGPGAFIDVAMFSYPSNTSSGGSLDLIDLSGVSALQNVGAGTNVVFRIVNWGGSNPAGTWYIFDVANSSASDFVIEGSVSPVIVLTPIESWRLQWFGITNNSGVAADSYVGTSDGMANLLKYALGLNPLLPTNSPVVGDISTGHLRLTSPKNPSATDVSFNIELTGQLAVPSWATNGTTIDQNTPILFQAHEDATIGSSESGFMRLRVTRP